MKIAHTILATLLASLMLPAAASAGSPHEHGVTHLEVVMDGNTLAIGLSGAGHHLVGFEHAPETDEQLAAWDDTRARLSDSGALFALNPGAGCRLVRSSVSPPTTAASGSEERHHHDHGHGHDHGGHDGHAHGHDEGGREGHAHDWTASYRFECSDPERLDAIEVGLFSEFPAHQEVRFQRSSAAGQSGGTLVPGRTRLALR